MLSDVAQLGIALVVASLLWVPVWLSRRRGAEEFANELHDLLGRRQAAAELLELALRRVMDAAPELLHAHAARMLEGETGRRAAAVRDGVELLRGAARRGVIDVEQAERAARQRTTRGRQSASAVRAELSEASFVDGHLSTVRGLTFEADLERAVFHLEKQVASLVDAIRDARRGLRQVFETLDDAEAALERCHEAGFRSRPLIASAAELRADVARAAAMSEPDPLGMAELVEPLQLACDRLRERAEALQRAADIIVRQLEPRLEELDARLVELRADGDAVREPGFEPDVMRARIADVAQRVARHMAFGDGAAAQADAAEALESAELLTELVARWARWRDVATHRIGSQVGRVQALRAQRDEVADQLAALEARAADAVVGPLRRRFDRVDLLLEHGLACLRVARGATDQPQQRHLAAGELLRRAQEAFDAVRDLYLEIGQKGEHLRVARERAEKAFAAAAERVAAIDELAEEPGVVLSPGTVSRADRVRDLYAELRRDAHASRPDWLAVAERADRLQHLAQLALRGATDDRDTGERVRDALRTAHEEHDRLRVWLGAHPERVGAAARLDVAVAAVQRARDALAMRPISWPDIETEIADGDRLFQEAIRLADVEMDDADVARAAVAAAHRALEVADRPYGFGLRADVANARDALSEAREALSEARHHDAEALSSTAAALALRARCATEARVMELREERAVAELRRPPAVASRGRARSGVADHLDAAELPPVDDPSFGTTSGWSSFGRTG